MMKTMQRTRIQDMLSTTRHDNTGLQGDAESKSDSQSDLSKFYGDGGEDDDDVDEDDEKDWN